MKLSNKKACDIWCEVMNFEKAKAAIFALEHKCLQNCDPALRDLGNFLYALEGEIQTKLNKKREEIETKFKSTLPGA